MKSRRQFLKTMAASGLACGFFAGSRYMSASTSTLPIGLQLYTVGADFDKDPAGTLHQVAAIGYKEVELSPLSKVPLQETKKALADAGLKSPSGHFILPDLMTNFQQSIDRAHELGHEYMIVTVPWVADPSRFQAGTGGDQMKMIGAMLNGLTLDDWKWNADQFNKIGEQCRKAGLRLGYHNHNFEFRKMGDTTGYDEFLRLTDPESVCLELDCGWMVVAGLDPVTYLKKYPARYRLLHLKDFKKGFAPSTALAGDGPGHAVPTELGRGGVDLARILSAIRGGEVRHIFVEQEPPFTEMPALEAIKVDYAYLEHLRA